MRVRIILSCIYTNNIQIRTHGVLARPPARVVDLARREEARHLLLSGGRSADALVRVIAARGGTIIERPEYNIVQYKASMRARVT